jgi:peptidoglycan hydrolase-like protein with peptidoglycan-binding domain
LQSFLGVTADGSFGPMTKAKVIEWQAQNGLKADGLFGTQSATKAGLAD